MGLLLPVRGIFFCNLTTCRRALSLHVVQESCQTLTVSSSLFGTSQMLRTYIQNAQGIILRTNSKNGCPPLELQEPQNGRSLCVRLQQG